MVKGNKIYANVWVKGGKKFKKFYHKAIRKANKVFQQKSS